MLEEAIQDEPTRPPMLNEAVLDKVVRLQMLNEAADFRHFWQCD